MVALLKNLLSLRADGKHDEVLFSDESAKEAAFVQAESLHHVPVLFTAGVVLPIPPQARVDLAQASSPSGLQLPNTSYLATFNSPNCFWPAKEESR